MSSVSQVQIKAQLRHWQTTLDAMVIDNQSTARLRDIQHIYDKCTVWEKEVECIPEYSQCLKELQAMKSKVKNIFNRALLQAAPSKLDKSLATLCKRDLKMLCVALRKGEGANIEKFFSTLPSSTKTVISENIFALRLASRENPSADELDIFIHNDEDASTLDRKYQAIIRSLPFDIAFDIAAAAGDVASIKSFLQAHRSEISQQTLEDAFVNAATIPHIEILQLLCESANTISPSIIHDIISIATRSGQKEVLQAVFSLTTSIRQDCLLQAMLDACDQPDSKVFEILLVKFTEVCKPIAEYLSKPLLERMMDLGGKYCIVNECTPIVIACCTKGRCDLLKLFDRFGQVWGDVSKMISVSVKNNQPGSLRFFLNSCSEHNTHYLHSYIDLAIEDQAPDVLPILSSCFSFMGKNCYNISVTNAILTQNIAVLENLLSPELTVILTQEDVQSFFSIAQSKGKYVSLNFLLKTFPSFLLESQNVLQWRKNEIVLYYIAQGDVKAVRSFLANGLHIRPYLFYKCLFLAIEYNNLEILSLFIHGEYAYEMDEEIRSRMLYKAAIFRHTECFKSLLSTGKIINSLKDSLLRNASNLPEEINEALEQAVSISKSPQSQVTFELDLLNIDDSCYLRRRSREISNNDLEQHPKTVLQKLTKEGLSRSYCIKIDDNKRKFASVQVYEALFDSLKRCGYLPNYLGIPYFAPDDEEKLSVFNMIGKLYCDFFIMNYGIKDPIVLGDVFSCDFFSCLEIAIKSLCDGESQETLDAKLLQKYKNCDTWAKDCFLFLENLDDPSLKDKVRELMKWQQKSGSAQEFAEQVFFSFKAPVVAVIQGALATDMYDPLFSAFIHQSAEQVCERLQGAKRTREDILAAICPLSQDPHLLQQVEWLKETVTSAFDTNNFEFISVFLRYLIGQSSWKRNQKIFIESSISLDNRHFFIADNRYNVFKIPYKSENKSFFIQDLFSCFSYIEPFPFGSYTSFESHDSSKQRFLKAMKGLLDLYYKPSRCRDEANEC